MKLPASVLQRSGHCWPAAGLQAAPGPHLLSKRRHRRTSGLHKRKLGRRCSLQQETAQNLFTSLNSACLRCPWVSARRGAAQPQPVARGRQTKLRGLTLSVKDPRVSAAMSPSFDP
ncbi:hypothetical protein SKAU_G00141660 [Synaphobranchus kaupii]|uniref:Uncharacterized protein n=1 Tax=Synaphobranchus kaupii TaxID=118154 RepID=A0A9Q1FSC3_SYNKA|nr:hypothetical protein SKAU_G00141660 [Synaphobranchus kaupii]